MNANIDYGGYVPFPFHWRDAANYSWSPEGERLAYVVRSTRVSNVWTTRHDGGDAQAQTNNADQFVRFYNPVWSPDGRRLAFITKRETPGAKHWGLSVITTGEPVITQQVDRAVRLLGWNAASDQLFFAAAEEITSEAVRDLALMRFDLATRQTSRLTTISAAYFPSTLLSPNRQQIALTKRVNDKDELWLYSLADERAQRLLTSDTPSVYFGGLAWSPDAASIYFSKQSTTNTLWALAHFPKQ